MSAPNAPEESRLEQLVDRALRELPPCRAPAGLEARVLAEIERRAGQPDRTAGAALLPATARALLIIGCGLCALLVWLLLPWLYQELTFALSASGFANSVNSVTVTTRMFVGLAELTARLAGMIPKDWLFGGLLAIGATYAGLISLGCLLLFPRSKVRSV